LSFLREEKEFQLEIVELNRKHYKVMFEYYTVLATGLALLFAVLCTFIPLSIISGEYLYLLIATVFTVFLGPSLVALWIIYMKRMDDLERQMLEIRKKYLW
jgi:hypothetical protein